MPGWDSVPSARSALFGRAEEIAAVRRLLDDGIALVTITGAGGIGKTRIAAEVCRPLSGPVTFIELSGTSEAGLPGELVRALVPEPGLAQDPVRSIAAALAGEPRAVVLDTFEHLLGSAGLLDELLAACPGLRLVVTSRSRLRLPGEHVVPVGALPTTTAADLFRERARAVGGLVGPGSGDDDTIAAVCELLDGSPLAIELAAVRTTMFTPAALLAALRSGDHSRLRMLAGGRTAGRHRDMRATIGWSYELLGEANRRLLRWLAVFPGSFDLETAGFVSGEPALADVVDHVADLVDWHLTEPAGGPADAPRFRLLDTIREFGADQLRDAGELAAARDRFAAWSLDFAERAIPGADSPAERVWLERIDRELPNLRAALQLYHERGDASRGARLAEALGPYWANRGPMAEGRHWFAAFGAQPGGGLSTRARAAATAWLVRLAVEEGDLNLTGLAAARDQLAGDPGQLTDWLRATEHLAYGLTMSGGLDAADELTAAGLEAATRADLPYWRCVFLQRRALSAQRHGWRELAVRYAQETTQAARAIGYDRIVARAEQIIAHERAAELGPEGTRLALLARLRAYEAAGDLRGVASTMANLGDVEGNVATAARWLADGIDTAARIGYWHGQAYCVVVTAVLLTRQDRLAEAVALDHALEPYLSTLRASMMPSQFGEYRELMDQTRAALGAEEAGAADGEAAKDWPAIRAWAQAVVEELAGAGDALKAGVVSETAIGNGEAEADVPVGVSDPSRVRRRGPTSNPELTGRELEVLAAIAGGHTNAQIATTLFLSPKTVMHHSVSVYRKLGVRGRAEAVALAYRTGLLTAGAAGAGRS